MMVDVVFSWSQIRVDILSPFNSDSGKKNILWIPICHSSKGYLLYFGTKLPIPDDPVPRVPPRSPEFRQGKLPSKTCRNWKGSYRGPSVYQDKPRIRESLCVVQTCLLGFIKYRALFLSQHHVITQNCWIN